MSDQLRCDTHMQAEIILDSRAGDAICSTCGVVVGERVIDVNSEWRSFNSETTCKDPSRVGAPEKPLLTGSDISTSIEFRRGTTNPFSLYNQRKTMNATDRQLTAAFNCIDEMAERINIPSSITGSAKTIFKAAFETGKLKSKKVKPVSAAALYIACRKDNVPRTFKEISAVCDANMKEVGKAYKNIIKCSCPSDYSPVVQSIDMVDRFVANLGLSSQDEKIQVRNLTRKFVRVSASLPCCEGRSPVSIVAGCLFLACYQLKVERSHKQVGDVCGAAESTVRHIERALIPYGNIMLQADVENARDDVKSHLYMSEIKNRL